MKRDTTHISHIRMKLSVSTSGPCRLVLAIVTMKVLVDSDLNTWMVDTTKAQIVVSTVPSATPCGIGFVSIFHIMEFGAVRIVQQELQSTGSEQKRKKVRVELQTKIREDFTITEKLGRQHKGHKS